MNCRHIILFSFVGLMASALISCGPKDSDKIGDAQLCLDTSTAANVNECVEKVEGLESPGAYIIRCSANFIQEGFGDPKVIVDVLKNLDNGGDGTRSFLAAMTFSTVAVANTTYSNCLKTNQKGLSTLAMAVKSATNILGLFGSIPANPTVTDITNALNGLAGANQTAAAETVGQAVVDVYKLSCQSGSQVNTTMCTQMTTAFTTAGSQDPKAIGAALLNEWKSH